MTYKIRQNGSWDDDYPMLLDLTVSGPKEVNTGLVSKDGHPIFRTPPPIGFGRDKEW